MQTTITRRATLAGSAALPFAGLAAQVKGANLPSFRAGNSGADDPAVRAFQVWRDAWLAHTGWFKGRADWADDDPEEKRLHDAEWEARKTLAETVATTPAGFLGQVILALDTFGDMNVGGELWNPENYSFGEWKDDLDGKLLTSMLASAQRLA